MLFMGIDTFAHPWLGAAWSQERELRSGGRRQR